MRANAPAHLTLGPTSLNTSANAPAHLTLVPTPLNTKDFALYSSGSGGSVSIDMHEMESRESGSFTKIQDLWNEVLTKLSNNITGNITDLELDLTDKKVTYIVDGKIVSESLAKEDAGREQVLKEIRDKMMDISDSVLRGCSRSRRETKWGSKDNRSQIGEINLSRLRSGFCSVSSAKEFLQGRGFQALVQSMMSSSLVFSQEKERVEQAVSKKLKQCDEYLDLLQKELTGGVLDGGIIRKKTKELKKQQNKPSTPEQIENCQKIERELACLKEFLEDLQNASRYAIYWAVGMTACVPSDVCTDPVKRQQLTDAISTAVHAAMTEKNRTRNPSEQLTDEELTICSQEVGDLVLFNRNEYATRVAKWKLDHPEKPRAECKASIEQLAVHSMACFEDVSSFNAEEALQSQGYDFSADVQKGVTAVRNRVRTGSWHSRGAEGS